MKFENMKIAKIAMLSSLVLICSIFGQFFFETLNSQKKNEATTEAQFQIKAKIESLIKYQGALKKSGFNYLVTSVANKSVPVDFFLDKNELNNYFFPFGKTRKVENDVKNITGALINLAQRNKWNKVSLLAHQLDLELRKSPTLENLAQSINYAVEKIQILDAQSSLDQVQTKILRSHLEQYKKSMKEIVILVGKIKSQKLVLGAANKNLSEAINSEKLLLQRVKSKGELKDKSNYFIELFLAAVGLVTALYFFSKARKTQERLSHEKNMTNFLFEKSQIAWAIFDLKGSFQTGNSYLRKLLKQVNPELEKGCLNWQMIAETLELKNLYHFDEIKEGSHHITVRLIINSVVNNFNFHLQKSERYNKILVTITPYLSSTQSENSTSKTENNFEAISINNLIEDSVEKLSTLIQATSITFNLEMREEIILKIDPEVFKNTMTQFIKDTLLFAHNQNECSRIDILLSQNFNKPEVRLLLYGNSISTNMLHMNISCESEERTLESSLTELEKNLAVLSPRIEIQNNLNQDKSNIFSHITVMLG